MEASARGAAEAGGHTIGITLKGVPANANPFIKEVIQADSLYHRLRLLLEKGRAFIILPGGTGTLVELALCLELQLKGMMSPKPIILLGSFWKDVLNTLQEEAKFQNPFKPNNINDFTNATLIATYSIDETLAKLNQLFSKSP
jgi:predicted Rossmann-fold nucleotide-binding protein